MSKCASGCTCGKHKARPNMLPSKVWCSACQKKTRRYTKTGRCVGCTAVESNATKTPQQRQTGALRANALRSPTQRHEIAKRARAIQLATTTPASAAEIRRKAVATLFTRTTDAERSEWGRNASRVSAQVFDLHLYRMVEMTPTERSRVGYIASYTASRARLATAIARKRAKIAALEAELAELTG